jgi:hypothetical protein
MDGADSIVNQNIIMPAARSRVPLKFSQIKGAFAKKTNLKIIIKRYIIKNPGCSKHIAGTLNNQEFFKTIGQNRNNLSGYLKNNFTYLVLSFHDALLIKVRFPQS